MRISHRFWMLHVFVLCIEYLCQGIIRAKAISLNREKIDASAILEAFCHLEYKLNVMECVDEETDGQALVPWSFCLNIDRDLSKKELITLSCKALYPGYKEVLDILTACVDSLMTPEEAATWMPILKSCAHTTVDKIQTARTYSMDNYETSSTIHKLYPTT